MGNDASLPLTAVTHDFPMASITFCDDDRITVLHLDSAELSTIGQAIKDTWTNGIQKEQSRCGSGWSFKLGSYPFGPSSNFKTVQQSQEMVMTILKSMHILGYQVVASGILGVKTDRSTLFFKKAISNIVILDLICVGFIASDKIQFTNLPSQLYNPIKDTVRSCWNLGIQDVNVQGRVLQLKLAGNPWTVTNNNESIMGKVLLQEVFAVLYRYQWVYYVNVNINGNSDCLIFRYEENLGRSTVPKFCGMSFGQGDRLRLINTSDETICKIQQVIETNWIPGIQHAKDFHGSWEFKLSGHPWNSVREESTRARYLMMTIFQEMYRHGWHNLAASYFNRDSSDRVVLIFQEKEPITYPMFCIAPHDDDKFWLINMPSELVSLFRSTLQSRWARGIQDERVLSLHFGNVVKLKLSGSPWVGGETSSPIHVRSFLCSLIHELSQRGWLLMRCADVTSRIVAETDGPDCPLDVYSLWFVYNRTPTMPQPSTPPPHAFNEPPPSYEEATGFWSEKH